MIVLLMFNDQERWTYKDLQQATNIPPAELKRALQGMLQGKGECAAGRHSMSARDAMLHACKVNWAE